MFVRVQGKRVETCPISGTIRRGGNAIEDAEYIQQLLESEKECSELTMCTDVDRNDKSRICEPGSVHVIGADECTSKVIVKLLPGLVGRFLALSYLVLDGYFGNKHTLQMARPCGVHLIPKHAPMRHSTFATMVLTQDKVAVECMVRDSTRTISNQTLSSPSASKRYRNQSLSSTDAAQVVCSTTQCGSHRQGACTSVQFRPRIAS